MNSSASSSATPQVLFADSRISVVLAWLETQQLSDSPTAQWVARQLNMSESFFRHKFKQDVGLAFGQYMRRLRFRRAKTLLESTSLSVKQAMLEVGIRDHSSFAKRYKRFFGETPSATKRRAREKWSTGMLLGINSISEKVGNIA